MAQPTTTRRALLSAATTALAYAGGAAIVGGAAVVATEAKSETASISPELRRLIAEADRAHKIAKDYETRVFDPAFARYAAARDAIPHITVQGVDSYDGGPAHWSTDQTQRVRRACAEVRHKHVFAGPGSEHARAYHQAQRRLVAATLRRRRQMERAMVDTGYSDVFDRSDELDLIASRAFCKVRDYPATAHADLCAILQLMEARNIGAEVMAPVLAAGIRRLAGEKQA